MGDVLAHPANYGVINAQWEGHTVGALGDPTMTDYSLNGPGSSYVFWDPFDPSARAHAVMADIAQQLISPANITNLTILGASNRLDVASVPIGLRGYVVGTNNLAATNWSALISFSNNTATASLFVPASSPPQFYRLRFPFAWYWP
jgi:phospholipase/lecithinase/hemolysin